MATQDSRHTRYSHRKLRHDKRTRQLYGEREDRGKWYRCWNCGFRCSLDRDALGDENSQSVLAYDTYTATQDGVTDATDLRNPVTYPIVANGCPFCGTLNWK